MKSMNEVKAFLDRKIAANDFPGIQYSLLSRDRIIFDYAGGSADLAADKPMQSDTTMMANSMTKTLTAASVLQLVEEKKVDLDKPVADYLETIPHGRGLKVRHLLAQTSGLPDPIPLRWVHLAHEHAQYDERTTLQEILARYPRLDFVPGEKYQYSNISYWLLGQIIATVSGSTYESYMRKNIFERLAVPEGEIDYVIPAVDRHAKGYLRKWSFMNLVKPLLLDAKYVGKYEKGWLQIQNHYLNGPAFGGIVASARAIGAFLQDQLQDTSKLFGKATRELFYEQQKNNRGELVQMTLGWHIGERNGRRYFFKEGGGAGFHSEMRIYPEAKVASVVIANDTAFDARGLLNQVDIVGLVLLRQVL